jgi:transposase InsO family protein
MLRAAATFAMFLASLPRRVMMSSLIAPVTESRGSAGRPRPAPSAVRTELIKPRGPCRIAEQIEIATLEYTDWFNHRRLYEVCGDIPPAELEAAYYRQNSSLTEAAQS